MDGDGVLVGDAARAAREQDDPVAESNGLTHVVRHEHDGQIGGGPQRFELVVEKIAGHGIECTEWLVHQEEVSALGERPSESNALAHTAGEFVGPARAEVFEVYEFQQFINASTPLALGDVGKFQCQLHVAAHAQPWEQGRFLKHQ